MKADIAAGVADNATRYLHIEDNLDSQKQPEYLQFCSEECQADEHKVPPNKTDQVQPVDDGLGRELKVHMGREEDAWLEDDNNLSKWENNELTASNRRILLAQWYCEVCLPPALRAALPTALRATLPTPIPRRRRPRRRHPRPRPRPRRPTHCPSHHPSHHPSYHPSHCPPHCLSLPHCQAYKQALAGISKRKYFEHTGGLLTADGSEDHLIKMEGVPDGETFSWVDDDDNDSIIGEDEATVEPEPDDVGAARDEEWLRPREEGGG